MMIPTAIPTSLPSAGNIGALQNPSAEKPASTGFAELFRSASQQVHALDGQAQNAVLGVLSGNGAEVHTAIIATQKAELAFQLVLQVRNKAVAAYQQMMQMQF